MYETKVNIKSWFDVNRQHMIVGLPEIRFTYISKAVGKINAEKYLH